MEKKYLGIGFLVFFLSYHTFAATDPQELIVGTYNLQNLFDTDHDVNKDDAAFLPLTHPLKKAGCMAAKSGQEQCLQRDYNNQILKRRLLNFKRFFQSLGKPIDILGVVEVENKKALTLLAQETGFSSVILEEGPDRRGIDTGLLYNANKIKYISHRAIRIPSEKPIRDILAVYFELPDVHNQPNILAVYVNHWASQLGPKENRVRDAKQLMNTLKIDQQTWRKEKFHAIVLGDFNVADTDCPNALSTVLENPNSPVPLTNTRQLAIKLKVLKQNLPLGTYFYPSKMKWAYLDHIYVTHNLIDQQGLSVDPGSYEIVSNSLNTTSYQYSKPGPVMGSIIKGVPRMFNINAIQEEDIGLSDHFPVFVRFVYPKLEN